MAHFALVEDAVVRDILVVSNDDITGSDGKESEEVGKRYIASLGLAGEWIQTSYSGSFRGKYAQQGDRYDATLDEFVAPVIE